MAASTSSKQEWMVILPDHEGVLEKRMSVRGDHISSAKQNVESGLMSFGGAFLEEPIQEGQPLKVQGSIILAHADSKQEVIEMLKSDIYTKSGVWDWNKVQILPFKTALRKAFSVP